MIVLPVLAAAWYAGSRLASSSHQLSSAPPPMTNGTAAPPQSRQFSPSPPVKTVSGLPAEPSAASPSTRIPEAQATPKKQIVRIPRQFQALAERLKTRRTFSEVQQFWERNKWWDKAFQNAMRQALSSPGVDPVLARWSEKVLKDLKAQKIKTDTWRTIVKDADADTVNELVDLYDEDGSFEQRCNSAMVKLEKVTPSDGADHADLPKQRSVSVADPGMGDLLRFDAERLKILVERHLLHTGSARAKSLLDNWDAALTKFVKVMPSDYAKALADIKARAAIAAE